MEADQRGRSESTVGESNESTITASADGSVDLRTAFGTVLNTRSSPTRLTGTMKNSSSQRRTLQVLVYHQWPTVHMASPQRGDTASPLSQRRRQPGLLAVCRAQLGDTRSCRSYRIAQRLSMLSWLLTPSVAVDIVPSRWVLSVDSSCGGALASLGGVQ